MKLNKIIAKHLLYISNEWKTCHTSQQNHANIVFRTVHPTVNVKSLGIFLASLQRLTCPTHSSQPRNNIMRLCMKKKPRLVPVNMGVWRQKIGSRPNIGIIRTKFRMHNLKVRMSIFNSYGVMCKSDVLNN